MTEELINKILEEIGLESIRKDNEQQNSSIIQSIEKDLNQKKSIEG